MNRHRNLSVVIPVYNAASTLRRCVDSILVQHFSDFELILVDDGSKDNSLDVCNELAARDNRIKVLHKPNGGVSSARNLGIGVAGGEWICFIDADDYIEQNYFPEFLDSAVDVYLQNFECFGGSCWNHKHYANHRYSGKSLKDFLENNMDNLVCVSPWCKIYKAEIIKKYRLLFDTRYRWGEDCLFNMKYYNFVETLVVLDTGRYMYYRDEVSRKEYAKKFALTVDDVILYVTELWDLYQASKYKSKRLLETEMSGFRYNSLLISKTPILDKVKWIFNPTINKILIELGYGRGIKGKFRQQLARIGD